MQIVPHLILLFDILEWRISIEKPLGLSSRFVAVIYVFHGFLTGFVKLLVVWRDLMYPLYHCLQEGS
jgi:hypothetical protein